MAKTTSRLGRGLGSLIAGGASLSNESGETPASMEKLIPPSPQAPPNPGEVWQVLDITATRTNITGTSGIYLYFNDLETSQLIQIFYGSSSSSVFMITDDATWDPHPVYISYPCQMQFTAANSTNWDDCQLQVNMIRVR